MRKEYISYNTVRDNAVRLAHAIHEDGFVPDIIYVLLRGGAYLGNVVSEYFKIVRKNARPVFYAAVVARSYTDVRERDRVMVDGWTYHPDHLRHGDRILLVDDIYDTGRTINHLASIINAKGIPREDIKIAVHDYKEFSYHNDPLPIQPDYYCRKHTISTPDDDIWIHYMSHEIVGLSEEEIRSQYSDIDEDVSGILRMLSGI
ncbi:MAG: phosphoribosyltransferase [Spirochaetales bacterium]|nr:phosphoribosyltransferase [Spirochaetales bacterium]MCF7939381.1 phosphoribosyltransferase [Spirochaetales bacterium]